MTMENFNIEERLTASARDYHDDKLTCLLEEDDINCGSIVYNEKSRVLKYICIYCSMGYDNIEYFCYHLADHIDKDDAEDNQDHVEVTSALSSPVSMATYFGEAENNKCQSSQDSQNYNEELTSNNTDVNQIDSHRSLSIDKQDDLEVSDIIIEDTEDADDIPIDDGDNLNASALVEECEDIEQLISAVGEGYENVSNSEIKSADRINASPCNTFEECFLKETNIEKIRSQCIVDENKVMYPPPSYRRKGSVQDLLRLKRVKKKKVTTVKVIAVKNRIAEIYDRIKNEQAKSQQMLASNGFLQQTHSMESTNMDHHLEQETQDALESMSRDHNDVRNPSCESHKKAEATMEVTRKIVGETLITLIPEGTKIPKTLPSPAENLSNTLNISPPKTPNVFTEKQRPPMKSTACPACGKIFRSHFSLTIHKRIHYLESDSAVKLAHKCPDCDQLFNKLSQLKQHVESVHYPDGFVCKICNRRLSSLSLLERHMIKVHLDRPFNCQQCGKNFSDPITYEEHVLSHNSGEVYKCHICGRKYSTEFFLMEHMRNHKEQIPVTCVVCGKVTLRITQHMKIHTPRPKRLLSCSVCGKIFNFSSGLSHHFKIMHKLPRPPPKVKKEHNSNVQKRKRKQKGSKKDDNFTISSDTIDISGQVIEEPSEIPEEVYNDEDLQSMTKEHTERRAEDKDQEGSKSEDVNRKEEEAKRVIVELIQNSYTSLFPDNLSSVLEVSPPIAAREETILAVNSIAHDC